MKCFQCHGSGEVIREEWDREWDRIDRNSPSHMDTNNRMDRSGIEKMETCRVCGGEKELERARRRDYSGVNAKIMSWELFDEILLKLEDGSYLKVAVKGVEHGKRK